MLTNTFLQRQRIAAESPELPTTLVPVARPLTIQEVADYLSVTHGTVRRWISHGKLRAHYYGRSIRIEPADLDKFREQKAKATYDHVSGGGR